MTLKACGTAVTLSRIKCKCLCEICMFACWLVCYANVNAYVHVHVHVHSHCPKYLSCELASNIKGRRNEEEYQ